MGNLKVKASLAVLEENIANKIKKGKTIVAGVTEVGIIKLPHLPVDISLITSTQEDLEAGSQAAAKGDHGAVADLIALEKKWDEVIRLTGNYITQESKGDKAFVLATGYDATSDVSVGRGTVVSLIDFTAIPTPTGASVVLESIKQDNAQGVLMAVVPKGTQVTKVGEVLMITIGTATIYLSVNTHHGVTINGLKSGDLMSAYGLAFNLNGMGPVSKTGNDFTPQP